MLYQLHELQRSILHPISHLASAGAHLYTNPYSPLSYTPFSRRLAATFDLVHRLGKDYEKPAFGLDKTSIDGHEVAVTERVVAEKPFCKLIHFERQFANGPRRAADPKILLVAPMSGHHATLLRDTVRALLPHHEVFITDWIDARMVPLNMGPFHLDDYVDYICDFIRLLSPDLNVISVCQPTVPVLAAVSLMATEQDPAVPRTIIMMGGPIDARKSPTSVNNLATEKPFHWFENHVIYNVPYKYPGYLRKVYPGFLQHAGFVAMNPGRHLTSHYDYYLQLIKGDGESADSHRAFYDEYNAVLDLAAEFYLDTIRVVFQEHLLPKGKWSVRGKPVRPQDITKTALLTIEGELDDISGAGQTRAAHNLCTGIPAHRQEDLVVAQAGHYGIFSGRRWREQVAPKIADFIRSH
ncbi:MAG: polyhydroxyalkanoate depolymerase [Betaproteobacteria bacterium]|nr:polyhydroxyalkanoate depolymerase [Betaproteobacteria bacterium]